MSREVVFQILLKRGPMSAEEIVPHAGIKKQCVDANLRSLKKYKSIRKVGEKKGRRWAGKPVIVWEAIPDETD